MLRRMFLGGERVKAPETNLQSAEQTAAPFSLLPAGLVTSCRGIWI